MRGPVRLVPVLASVLSFPSGAFAQASIAGAARDTSGAVLPGVTVEASSPVLIERARSAVTDGMGQHARIIDLEPGTYAVTFTLAGFNTLKREGIELTGSFVATVNAELRVGAVAETITVTGETPIIDVQSSKGQQTLKQDVINAIPTGRTYFGLAVLVPGITTSTQDVGGIAGPATVTYSNHGGPLTEGRLQVDGMSVGSAVGGSGVSYYVADVGHAQEIVFSTAGGLGEAEVGGPVMSIVPSSGGNTIRGSFFANYANGAMQSSNYTQALKNAGLTAPNSLINVWDTSGAFGGPIVKDRLWYYWAGRLQGNQSYVTGMYYNLNAGNPAAWTYAPDLSRQAIQDGSWKNTSLRLTLQPTSRNKINLFWDEQRVCLNCVLGGDAVDSPEAASTTQGHPTRVQQATWTSPVTNRLLLEAGFGTYLSHFGGPERPGNPVDLIRVTEQGGSIPGLTYRSQNWSSSHSGNHNWRASASYVTGAHVLKVGYNGAFISYNTIPFTDNENLAYRFNNGVPNQLTMTAGPFYTLENVQTTALYAQDQSRLGRLTLQGAVRYDRASGSYLDEQVGPTVFVPNGLTFPGGEGVPGYNDISPRAGAAYDLFGNGKTALKMTMGKMRGCREPQRAMRGHQSGQSHCHQHDSVVERRQSQLHAGLQSPESRRERRVRTRRESNLRDERVQLHVRSRDPPGLGRPCARLEPRAVRPATTQRPPLGPGHLQLALVPEFFRHRQPQRRAVELHAVHDHGAGRSTLAGRRRQRDRRPLRRRPLQVRLGQ